METGFTTISSVKLFWPDVVNEFPAEYLESQLTLYILRAEYLLNRVGVINTSATDAVALLEMGTNLLVRRLIYADKHPSASAEPANVRTESGHGVYYSLNPKRDIKDIIGDEVLALLGSVIVLVDHTVMMTTQDVFSPPYLWLTETNNNIRYKFTTDFDDDLYADARKRSFIKDGDV